MTELGILFPGELGTHSIDILSLHTRPVTIMQNIQAMKLMSEGYVSQQTKAWMIDQRWEVMEGSIQYNDLMSLWDGMKYNYESVANKYSMRESGTISAMGE